MHRRWPSPFAGQVAAFLAGSTRSSTFCEYDLTKFTNFFYAELVSQ